MRRWIVGAIAARKSRVFFRVVTSVTIKTPGLFITRTCPSHQTAVIKSRFLRCATTYLSWTSEGNFFVRRCWNTCLNCFFFLVFLSSSTATAGYARFWALHQRSLECVLRQQEIYGSAQRSSRTKELRVPLDRKIVSWARERKRQEGRGNRKGEKYCFVRICSLRNRSTTGYKAESSPFPE